MSLESHSTSSSSDKSHRYAIIVAGGSGTRLWPVSRKDLPKQIQKFVGDKTLIDETVARLNGLLPHDHIYISTTENYQEKIQELLPEIPAENIIVEPIARGTVAAFALFTHIIYQRDSEATIFSLASDHAVTGIEQFHTALDHSYSFVEKHPKTIALIGIKPDRPDTGLGYIKTDQVLQKNPYVYSVEKYVEKPSYEIAKQYLDSGEYYWNAAYYCFKAKTLIDAYDEADPGITKWVRAYVASGDAADYLKIPLKAHEIEVINTSLHPLAVVPAEFSWSDIGNWHTLHSLLSNFNNIDNFATNSSKHIDIDSHNCLVFSTDDKLVATIGLNDLAIVSTDDVILVLNKNQSQDVKHLLEILQTQGLTEYL